MYVVFGNTAVDSNDFKEIIEGNTDLKVLKDMSKGSKREDIVAFNLSVSIKLLNEEVSCNHNLDDLAEDDLFEEYMSVAEELAIDIEEFLPEGSISLIKAYKLDLSDNDVKLVIAIAHEDFTEKKLRDIIKRLLTQVE